MPSVAELMGRCLAAAGVARLYGDPSPVPAAPGPAPLDPGHAVLAERLADAEGSLGPAPGTSRLGRALRLSSRPGGRAEPVRVVEPGALPAALARAAATASGPVPGTARLDLDLDLAGPAPAGLGPQAPHRPDPEPAPPLPRARRGVVLAGPGVVRSGCVEGLRAFASATGFGVANTWGAKGVFDWRSPFHLGTAGLQALDFELLGFGRADLVIATGIDPEESPEPSFSLAPVAFVPPARLAELAASWPHPPVETAQEEFRTRLSRVCLPLQEEAKFPLSPGRAVGDLRRVLEGDDLLVADAGPAGLWAARAFPTTRVDSVRVPTRRAPGFAAAAALVAALRRPPRRAVALTTAPLDPVARAALDWAGRLAAPLVLEVWSHDPVEGALEVTSAEAHAGQLRDALARRAPVLLRVPVDGSDTRRLVDVAGDVVAWPERALD